MKLHILHSASTVFTGLLVAIFPTTCQVYESATIHREVAKAILGGYGGDELAKREYAVKDENTKDGRYSAGLPDTGDSQLLFVQSAIDKMDEQTGAPQSLNTRNLSTSKR